MTIRVTLPADVHQIDQTGFVWTFLDEAEDPARVVVDTVIVAGDGEDPGTGSHKWFLHGVFA